jgi:hypothetical protein
MYKALGSILSTEKKNKKTKQNKTKTLKMERQKATATFVFLLVLDTLGREVIFLFYITKKGH